MSGKEPSADADDYEESPLVVYVDSPDTTDSPNTDDAPQPVVPSTVLQPDITNSVMSSNGSPPDVTQTVIPSISDEPDVTQSVVFSIVSRPDVTQSVIHVPGTLTRSNATTSMIPSTVLSHSTSSKHPFMIMDRIDMPREVSPLNMSHGAAVKICPDETLASLLDSGLEVKSHSTTCLTCKDGVYLKRPMFEKCVRRFRSKLYEIAGISEDRNTPILPTYKLRLWKDALCVMIGSCDTRKLNDCYKHDMKTARSPLPIWREIDKLFLRWEKKEVAGQVRDTLKQTQFKIINAVPETQRLELLIELNQSNIIFPVFLEKCREETARQNQSMMLPLDVEDITCTSVSDGEDDVTHVPCTSVKPNSSPPQLSGQVEDLLRKVVELEQKWRNAERNAQESDNRSLTVYSSLQELTQKLHHKEEELASFQQSSEERENILERTLKLKSSQLTAKEKEVELVTARSRERVKICEAELSLKSALLTAKERELELKELTSDLEMKDMKKRLHEKDVLIALKEEELRYYSQTQSEHPGRSSSQDRQDRRTNVNDSQTVPNYHQQSRSHHQIPSHNGPSVRRRMDTEVVHIPAKRIKQEPEYL